MLLRFTEWIDSLTAGDQTEIVWHLIEQPITRISIRSYNTFFAVDRRLNEIIISENELSHRVNSVTEQIRNRLVHLENEITILFETKENRFHKHKLKKIQDLLSAKEELEKTFKRTINDVTKDLAFAKDHIRWSLIQDRHFIKFLIDFGLPVLEIGKSTWWGRLVSSGILSKQDKLLQQFEHLKINPLDPTAAIIKDIKLTLQYLNEMPNMQVKLASETNLSRFYYHERIIKTRKRESKQEREIRVNYVVNLSKET